MRVGFGVTALARALASGGADGIAHATQELGARLTADAGIDLRPFSYGYPLPAAHPLAASAQTLGAYPPRAAFSAYTNLPAPGSRFAQGLDLFHATDHVIPQLPVPVIATLMDAVPLSHPEWAASRFRGVKNDIWRRLARRAAHIITISEFSKGEIVAHFGIPAARITAIPLGVDARWFAPVSAQMQERVRATHALPERFLLFTGTLQPRKNLAAVIDAHRALPEAMQWATPLVIVGRAGWQSETLVQDLSTNAYGPTIRWLRYLPGEDLQAVTAMAEALVFPSLYEGFGLPVLEAFASGTPVITSNATSLPEVAGDAAMLVDPRDAGGIRDAMEALLTQPHRAAELRAEGLARARHFTWERTARATAELYRRFAV